MKIRFFFIYIYLKGFNFLGRILFLKEFHEISFWYKYLPFKRFVSISKGFEEPIILLEKKFFLRPFTSDYLVYNQVLVKKEYESVHNLATIYKIPLYTMIDCGANIGITSLYFKNKYRDLKIYAIEPNNENFLILSKNLGSFHDISLRQFALWNNDQLLSEVSSFRDKLHWSKQYKFEGENNTTSTVSGKSLSFAFNDSGFQSIDFLKIDIEGSEFNLFNSEINVEILKNVKIISVEIHVELGEPNFILDILKSKGFFLFLVGETVIGINSKFIS